MTPDELDAVIYKASRKRLRGAVSMETRRAIFFAGMRAAARLVARDSEYAAGYIEQYTDDLETLCRR